MSILLKDKQGNLLTSPKFVASKEQISASVDERIKDGTLTFLSLKDAEELSKRIDEIASNPSTGSITESNIDPTFLSFIRNEYVTPEMFGAVGNGVHDDTAAIQAAIDSNKVILCTKTYYLSESVYFHGMIIGGTFKVLNNARITSLFYITGPSIFRDVVMDCYSTTSYTASQYPTVYNAGIYHDTSDSMIVDHCTFKNIYTGGIIGMNMSGSMQVTNCIFDMSINSNPYYCDGIHLSSCSGTNPIQITNNQFLGNATTQTSNGMGIFLEQIPDRTITIDSNIFIGLGRNVTNFKSRFVIDLYFNVNNTTISNNQIIQSTWSAIRLHSTKIIHVTNNMITESAKSSLITDPCIHIMEGPSDSNQASTKTYDILINDNTIKNENIPRWQSAISITGMTGSPRINNIQICGNHINGRFVQLLTFDRFIDRLCIMNNVLHNSGSGEVITTSDTTFTSSSFITINGNDIRGGASVIDFSTISGIAKILLSNNRIKCGSTIDYCIVCGLQTTGISVCYNVIDTMYGLSNVENVYYNTIMSTTNNINNILKSVTNSIGNIINAELQVPPTIT